MRCKYSERYLLRQADLKHGSPRLGFHPNRPLVIAHYPLHDVEAQPGAFTNPLRGEERIENAALYLGWNAEAVIANFHQKPVRLHAGYE